MGWRTVVVSKPSKLDLRLGFLSVRDSEKTAKIHISEIDVLIIENTASSITTALLSELIKQKVKVIFCDEKQNPSSELVAFYGRHNCSQTLKTQINWRVVDKQIVWTSIISQKIKMQADNLLYFGLEQEKMLRQYIEEIEFNDESNREGHAAKVYFNAMFGKDFSRTDECPINAMLNYGYSIILSIFNREIVANGYNTMLGLFHDNVHNSFNLSCDLMEPFRPIVDRFVKMNIPEKFDKEEKRAILSIINNEFVIDSKKQTLANTIKIYARSVFDAIENSDMAFIKYYRYEL